MHLVRAHGDHGPEYVDTWEPIMGFTTQADAAAYVRGIYDQCTAAEKFRVRLAFLGDLTDDAYDEFPSGERPLALKRAGDWGMIRHCKDHGIVFVTQDRFCALYAALMDVETMFMRVVEHDGVNQYSFVLMTRETPRAQRAGSSHILGPVAMAAVIALTVFMAVVGSVGR